jgi:hypothetical protein
MQYGRWQVGGRWPAIIFTTVPDEHRAALRDMAFRANEGVMLAVKDIFIRDHTRQDQLGPTCLAMHGSHSLNAYG